MMGFPLPPGFPAPPPGFPMPPMPLGAAGMRPLGAPVTRETVASSSKTLKPGTVLVYADEDVSPVRSITSFFPPKLDVLPG